MIKTTAADRLAYMTLAPENFQMPESFQNLAYMLIRLDLIERNELNQLLVTVWTIVAPKRLINAYNSSNTNIKGEMC